MAKFELFLARFTGIALIAGFIGSSDLLAQEIEANPSDQARVTLSNGDAATIRIGPEHISPGETRYPRRTTIGNMGVVVEFSVTPVAQISRTWTHPPRVADLVGNPARQAALDLSAKPGDFVTPPAANR